MPYICLFSGERIHPGPSLPTSKWIPSPQPHFFTRHLAPLLLAAPILKISVDHTPLSYHSPLFLPISLARVATGFLYPSCHAWGPHLILIRKWEQLQGVSLCPFPFPRLFAVGKWGEQRRFPTSHRMEQSFQALCAPSYPLAFSRGWIKLLSRAGILSVFWTVVYGITNKLL